jgi:hypothetical protein
MNTLTSCETTSKLCPYLEQLQPFKPQGTCPDLEKLKNYLVEHYALIAMNPGSIDHARHMVQKYKTTFPGLDTLIVKRLKEINDDRKL